MPGSLGYVFAHGRNTVAAALVEFEYRRDNGTVSEVDFNQSGLWVISVSEWRTSRIPSAFAFIICPFLISSRRFSIVAAEQRKHAVYKAALSLVVSRDDLPFFHKVNLNTKLLDQIVNPAEIGQVSIQSVCLLLQSRPNSIVLIAEPEHRTVRDRRLQ